MKVSKCLLVAAYCVGLSVSTQENECGFDCSTDEDCGAGLLCAAQHAAALEAAGLHPSTADCDFLPTTFVACFRAGLITNNLFLRSGGTVPPTSSPQCDSELYGYCNPPIHTCCDGMVCKTHETWNVEMCLPPDEAACVAKHQACDSSSDCCADNDADTCRFHNGYGSKICMGATDCNAWVNSECSAENTCCDGLVCQYSPLHNKNLCSAPTCTVKYGACDSSADCCDENDVCRFNQGYARNVCMGAQECNSWLNGDCSAENTCCDGLECAYSTQWQKNLCRSPL